MFPNSGAISSTKLQTLRDTAQQILPHASQEVYVILDCFGSIGIGVVSNQT
jgi:hypothetical protein